MILGGVIFIVGGVEYCKVGGWWKGVGENEIGGEGMGIELVRRKVVGFGIGG